jgi:hypothetical protein
VDAEQGLSLPVLPVEAAISNPESHWNSSLACGQWLHERPSPGIIRLQVVHLPKNAIGFALKLSDGQTLKSRRVVAVVPEGNNLTLPAVCQLHPQ